MVGIAFLISMIGVASGILGGLYLLFRDDYPSDEQRSAVSGSLCRTGSSFYSSSGSVSLCGVCARSIASRRSCARRICSPAGLIRAAG